MNLVIIKYNAGNVQSVSNALNRLGITPIVSDDPEIIRKADKIIFPGVGEASTAMNYLKKTHLDQLIPTLEQPFLGICLGMQVMCAHSEENNTDGMSIFKLGVKRFHPNGTGEKVPHMGWNLLENIKGSLLADLPQPPYVYYVHSYYVELGEDTLAETTYLHPYSAVLQKGNFYATQFHPEKSGAVGAKILENFVQLVPQPIEYPSSL